MFCCWQILVAYFFSPFGLELQAAFILADKMVWESLEVDWHHIALVN